MKNYLSLIKFSHTIFALPFALVGLTWGFMQQNIGWERWDLIVKVVLCMIFARSAAMAFNRYIDRDIDAKNARTIIREIPAGVISPNNALWFIIFNSLAFVITTFFINSLCFYLSPVALLVILGYSYTKRFTALCHLVLGLGLALAPVGAYFAVAGTTKASLIPILLGLSVLTWVSGFDIIYALQDEEFDRENKLNSIPAWLGAKNALRFSEGLHLISAMSILSFAYLSQGSIFIWVAAFFFIAMLVWQHRLVKPNDLSKVNMAFFTSNGIASVVFAILVIGAWLWGK